MNSNQGALFVSTSQQPTEKKAVLVADVIISYLEQLGVEYVFGIPGGAIEPFYDALARSERRHKIRHVLARHESGAVAMADGYARETGRIGVCCATSGPGTTNMITGMANAYENNTPILAISGQPALPVFGKNPLQESSCTGINTLSMMRHCTFYNSMISHARQVETKVISALQSAYRMPQGPAHLSIPVDVMRSAVEYHAEYNIKNLLRPNSLVDQDAIEQLTDLIQSSQQLVLLIGNGCGEAISSIMQFAIYHDARFVTTPDGKGLINPRHRLFRGVFGFGGHQSAMDTLRKDSVDLIIAIGTSMGEWNSGGWSDSVLNDRLVHIDHSEINLSRTPMARLHVRGRIQSVFNRLNQPLDEQVPEMLHQDNWDPDRILQQPEQFNSEATPITPQRLMRELGERLPPTVRFLVDTGNSLSWCTHYLQSGSNRRSSERRVLKNSQRITAGQRKTDAGWLRLTMNFANMGWAIGAAVGTAIANPELPVVCITGDGSMLMNGQEISVAVAEKLTVIFIVLNDEALGMVKHGQRLSKAESIGHQLPPTDFAMLAHALGAEGYTIKSPQDFNSINLDQLCRQRIPALLDVHIDPEAVPPMNVRIKTLADLF